MDAFRIIEFVLAVVAFGIVAVGAFFFVRAEKKRQDENRAKQVNMELEQLVDARGEKIKDLEAALDSERKERREEAAKFRVELAELRGQVEAMRDLKAVEIADQVVLKLRDANVK